MLKKRILALLLLVALLLGTGAFAPQTALAVSTVQVGDHVYFGQYNGEEILWQVTAVGGGSVELLSVYVLFNSKYHNNSSVTTLTFEDADGSETTIFKAMKDIFTAEEQGKISKYSLPPIDLGRAYTTGGAQANYWTADGPIVSSGAWKAWETRAKGGGNTDVTQSSGVRPVITINAQAVYDSPQVTVLTPSDSGSYEKSTRTDDLTIRAQGKNARAGDVLRVSLEGSGLLPQTRTLVAAGDFDETFTISAANIQAIQDGDYTITAELVRMMPGYGETILHTATSRYRVYTENGTEHITVNGTPATTTRVSFGGSQWYLIKANATSWTLLAVDKMGSNTIFGDYNSYSGSTLQTAITGILNTNFTAEERAAMADYDLSDASAGNAKLWPLSYDEADAVNVALRYIGAAWWLRSPAGKYDLAYCVDSSGGKNFLNDVTSPRGIRPAFQLNLSSVLFTSESSTTAPTAADAALARFTTLATPKDLKLTLSNGAASLNGFSPTNPGASTAPSGSSVPIGYTYSGNGAQGGEFLRVRLMDGNKIAYQGVIAANLSGDGTASLPLTGVPAGTYTVLAWVEKDGGAGKTNLGSNPVSFSLTVTNAPIIDGQVSGTDTITLAEGYATYTKAYTIAGNPTPSVSIDGANTANASVDAAGVLTIPTGLAAGSYTVTIKASNTHGNAFMTVTVNVTDSTNTDTDYIIEFIPRTITDKQTGVTVSGEMTSGARLIVQERALHTEGACPACDEIRARQAAGELILLYDIAVTGGYAGELEVSIPVGEQYNGQMVTILHCVNGGLESVTCVVQNGVAKGTFKKLSPFAVVRGASVSVPTETVVDPPKTGDAGGYGMAGVALVLGALGACVVVRKKRSTNS